MVGQVLTLENIISPDLLAVRMTERYMEWETLRQIKKNDWEEIRRYVYATDTTQTTNAQLPWKNKTTTPKLCQIRDNLYSNYTAVLFPQRKYLIWEANEKDSASAAKRDAITNYMSWCISQPSFKHEMDKIIMDYIDFGNCFATVKWVDERVQQLGMTQAGFVGPALQRISPLDTVMNPTAPEYENSPKFIRSIITLGELRDMLMKMSTDDNQAEYEELYDYLKNIRYRARSFQGDWQQQDNLYNIDGFSSFRAYLLSDYCEVLTFYGDWYDHITDEFQKNRVITIVDRHKLIGNKPNPSFFGNPPIYHVPWRKKQDNLWGMGPLDNLIGLQYRLDHVENMKADVMDLITYPVQKIKGFVDNYTWQPGEKIFVSEEGDVELVVPDVQALSANMEIERIMTTMEEMAGAPREAMGFRSPGEKTKYEVQRLENAAARLFQNKIKQFEEQLVEKVINAMLELARRNLTGATVIKVFDDELQAASFVSLTVDDITGIGRIRPVAARHFAEQADMVQNLTNLAGSNLWPVVQPHVSGIKLAKFFESTFNVQDYNIFFPYIGLAEQADAQKQAQVLEEQLHSFTGTATGMNGDFDIPPHIANQMAANQTQSMMQGQPMQGGPSAPTNNS